MTHDELLARIKRYGDWAEVAFDTSPTDALRAVVKVIETYEWRVETFPAKTDDIKNFDDGALAICQVIIQNIEKELA